MQDRAIYLDYAAATPLDERVFAVMQPFLQDTFYNPSAVYTAGRHVRAAYESARASLALQIGAKPINIVLTAGATESINMALQGILAKFPNNSVAYAATEHQATRNVAKQYNSSVIQVDEHGLVNEASLFKAIDDTTVLVTIGVVNSEIGTKQPIKTLSAAIQQVRADRQRRGIKVPLYFHSDASQAMESVGLHVNRLSVDLMTLSAGKIYGPKQTGLLYIRRGVSLTPLTFGGGQEQGLRPGTEDVASAVGFAKAFELAMAERRERSVKLRTLKAAFLERLRHDIGDIMETVPVETAAPHILHIAFPGIDAERLLYMLDERGVMVATGAACAANKQTSSHVLRAIGLDELAVQGSIRCSFGYEQNRGEIERAARIFAACLHQLGIGHATQSR